jgi:hypothetical protein
MNIIIASIEPINDVQDLKRSKRAINETNSDN